MLYPGVYTGGGGGGALFQMGVIRGFYSIDQSARIVLWCNIPCEAYQLGIIRDAELELLYACMCFMCYRCPYLVEHLSPAIPAVAAVLMFFTMATLIRTGTMDPGVLPRAVGMEAAVNEFGRTNSEGTFHGLALIPYVCTTYCFFNCLDFVACVTLEKSQHVC